LKQGTLNPAGDYDICGTKQQQDEEDELQKQIMEEMRAIKQELFTPVEEDGKHYTYDKRTALKAYKDFAYYKGKDPRQADENADVGDVLLSMQQESEANVVGIDKLLVHQ